MFKIFSSRKLRGENNFLEAPEEKIPAGKTQEQMIKEIHTSYDNAYKEILDMANKTLADTETIDINTAERLTKLGFFNSKKAKLAQKAIEERKQAKTLALLVEHYSAMYPQYKFITREKIGEINGKYGLICVKAEEYIGEIPEKNIRDIEAFPGVKPEDAMYEATLSFYKSFETSVIGFEEVKDLKSLGRVYGGEAKEAGFYISCPPGETKISYRHKIDKDGFVVKDDPIVMKPVNGGFLIITKWGLEGDDKDLTNENLN